jgi:broad specificity phosphatase PhoE
MLINVQDPDRLIDGNLFLLRHAQTELNALGLWQCWQDESLSTLGIRQAKETRNIVNSINPEIIISSDLKRAKETADIVSRGLGVEVKIDKRLRERNCGPVQGLTSNQIMERFGISFTTILSDQIDHLPGVEKSKDFTLRVNETVDDLHRKFSNKRILIVTHGGFQRSFYETHMPFGFSKRTFPNCSITGYRNDAGVWNLMYIKTP